MKTFLEKSKNQEVSGLTGRMPALTHRDTARRACEPGRKGGRTAEAAEQRECLLWFHMYVKVKRVTMTEERKGGHGNGELEGLGGRKRGWQCAGPHTGRVHAALTHKGT